MRPELAEALSAFVDGEPVEAALLSEALASEEARPMLLDAMLLRAAVALEGSEDLEALDRRVLGAIRASERPRSRTPLWAAAAAVLLLALGVGAALRLWRRAPAEVPPPATREVTFTYGVDWRPQS